MLYTSHILRTLSDLRDDDPDDCVSCFENPEAVVSRQKGCVGKRGPVIEM